MDFAEDRPTEPHLDFTFAVYNMALFDVFIDDAIKGPIVMWDSERGSYQLARTPFLKDNHAARCHFRGKHQFTVQQDVTPKEALYISAAPEDSFFQLTGLKITLHGSGFSDVRLDTQITVNKNKGYRWWATEPIYIFGGDEDRDSILRDLHVFWEEGKILLYQAERGDIEYLTEKFDKWEKMVGECLTTRVHRNEKLSFLNEAGWEVYVPNESRVRRQSKGRFLNKVFTRVIRLERLIEKLTFGSPIVRD